MSYYKVFDLNYNPLGIITSNSFRMIHPQTKRMLCCQEREAQYLYLNNSFYRAEILNTELPDMKNKYPEVYLRQISEEEYKNELEKENLE